MTGKPQKLKPLYYEFEITLGGVRPPVWRVFRVPANITFNRLHQAIQIVMGWQDYHLYEFRFGPYRVGLPDDEFFIVDKTHFDAMRKRISTFDFEPHDMLAYLYDFGDDWIHSLRVERVGYHPHDRAPYECFSGERACPPEDVGGFPGYAHYLDVLSRPDDPEYEDIKAWRGGHFDPDSFDREAVNVTLNEQMGKA